MTEDQIQRLVIRYCRLSRDFKLAFHINNEGKKTLARAKLDKGAGVLAGVPDICIPVDGGRTIWLELKTEKGRLSDAQKKIHARLRARGHAVYVCYGYSEALELLQFIEMKGV